MTEQAPDRVGDETAGRPESSQARNLADLSPSEVLRVAAAVVRGLGNYATPGPWAQGSIGDYGWTVHGPSGCIETADSDQGRNDAAWIAHLSPAVAEPLAVILGESANMFALYDGRGWARTRVHQAVSTSDRAALAFARCILEGQP